MDFEKNEIDKLIEDVIPRDFYGWNNFEKSRWSYDIDALNNSISKPVWDLLDRGGKRWRPFLMKLCFEVVKGEGNIDNFLPIVEVIHNGTLMIDDIEDDSDLRRGNPCIHKIYGNDIAINAGNSMYYFPVLKVFGSNLEDKMKMKIYEIINKEMVKLHMGQGMDIFWHKKNAGIPSENEYLQMCAFKTGTLARMSAKIGAVLGGANDEVSRALGEFAESIGVAFQIQDDILNICPTSGWGKDFGDDISEGKKTLIFIKALSVISDEDARDLIGILNLKTKNKVLIEEAIRIIKKSGVIEHTFNVAKKLVQESWDRLNGVLDSEDTNKEAMSKLKILADQAIERKI